MVSAAELRPLAEAKARGLNVPDARGALVNQVLAGSPAGKAGIEIGDVITSFNGAPINQSSDLPPLVGVLVPGTKDFAAIGPSLLDIAKAR